jgi:hypothetical protein
MCTKYWNDGDVHAYFSPYESPYDAFITYMNTLNDFEEKVADKLEGADLNKACLAVEELRLRMKEVGTEYKSATFS